MELSKQQEKVVKDIRNYYNNHYIYFLKDNGILDQLEALGIVDGDTVQMYGLKFDYYK